jgi:hypothetical protein
VEIKAKGKVHGDVATKKNYWNPMFEKYFTSVNNAGFVVLVFTATEIAYHSKTWQAWTCGHVETSPPFQPGAIEMSPASMSGNDETFFV